MFIIHIYTLDFLKCDSIKTKYGVSTATKKIKKIRLKLKFEGKKPWQLLQDEMFCELLLKKKK